MNFREEYKKLNSNIMLSDSAKEKIKSNINSKNNIVKFERSIVRVAQGLVAMLVIGVIGGNIVNSVYAKKKLEFDYSVFDNANTANSYATVEEKKSLSSSSVANAIEDGYVENIDMEYSYIDTIGIKVNNLILSTDTFQMDLDLNFKNELEITDGRIDAGILVFDDDMNIYYSSNSAIYNYYNISEYDYIKKVYNEFNLKEPKYEELKNLNNSSGFGSREISKNNILIKIDSNSKTGFLNPKKLYVRVYDLGYHEANYTDEWKFEITVPEKFYMRDDFEYTAINSPNGFELKKAVVSETGMSFIAKVEGFEDIIDFREHDNVGNNIDASIYIEDENGELYPVSSSFSYDSVDEEICVSTYFAINKKLATEKLYLHVLINDEMHTVELIRK